MKRYKVSRYNKFLDCEKGVHLAFNGMTGGFATLTHEKYEWMQKILTDPNGYKYDTDDKKDLLDKLTQGGFLIEEDVDEIAVLKVRKRISRFRERGLGLTIAPTMSCNFKCSYCYEDHIKGSIMNDDVIKGILHFVVVTHII